jgi:uncharacterized protein (TIGR00251 family)
LKNRLRPTKASAGHVVAVRVRVLPRGSRSEIQGFLNGFLRIKTTASPTDGKANADVIRQLAKAFKVPATQVTLVRGASYREKIFHILAPRVEPDFSQLGQDAQTNTAR